LLSTRPEGRVAEFGSLGGSVSRSSMNRLNELSEVV
jgi:hypothetical protein